MKVVIDGCEFVPKDSVKVEAHGIAYDSIANWLFNIQSVLLNRWVTTLREGRKQDDPETLKLYDKVKEFQRFTEEFLGYKDDEKTLGYIEIPDWTLADYGKERIKLNKDDRRTDNIGGDKTDQI